MPSAGLNNIALARPGSDVKPSDDGVLLSKTEKLSCVVMTPEKQLAESISKAIAEIATAISGMIASQIPSITAPCARPENRAIEPEPDLMTKQDVTKFLKISMRTVDNLMRRGYLPYYRIGRIVRFRRKDIVERLDERYRLIGRRLR